MSFYSLASLIVTSSKEAVFTKGLQIANGLQLLTESWRKGDPTRTLFYFVADVWAEFDERVATPYVRGAFLGLAQGQWLKLRGYYGYGVTMVESTYATCSVRLTNEKGGTYDFGIGDVTVQSSLTKKTYTNTSTGTLSPGTALSPTTVDLDFEAVEPGSESSASIGEIDTMVTVFNGVTCASLTTAVAFDEEDPEDYRQRCLNKLGALSPNGPAEAYAYIATTPALNGGANVTQARVVTESETGQVRIILRGPSGAPSDEDRDLVEAAIVQLALPLCVTPTVDKAINVEQDLVAEVWIYERANLDEDGLTELVEASYARGLAKPPLGGDVIPPDATGAIHEAVFKRVIQSCLLDDEGRAVAHPDIFRVAVTTPAGDVALDIDEVLVAGEVTLNVHVVPNPGGG